MMAFASGAGPPPTSLITKSAYRVAGFGFRSAKWSSSIAASVSAWRFVTANTMVLPHVGQRRTPSLPMKPFSWASRNSRTMARLRSGIVNVRSSAHGSTVMGSDWSNSFSSSARAAASIAVQSSSSRATANPSSAAVLTVIVL